MRADASAGYALDLSRLREQHERAVAASRAGSPAVAERLLREVLRRLGDAMTSDVVTLRMQALITLAKVESELRDVETGLSARDHV